MYSIFLDLSLKDPQIRSRWVRGTPEKCFLLRSHGGFGRLVLRTVRAHGNQRERLDMSKVIKPWAEVTMGLWC